MGQAMAFGLIVVSIGAIIHFKNYQFNRLKTRKKYERRKKIFEYKNKMFEEMCRWNKEHPKPTYTVAEQNVVYKGGSNLLDNDAFKQALRRKGGVTNV